MYFLLDVKDKARVDIAALYNLLFVRSHLFPLYDTYLKI